MCHWPLDKAFLLIFDRKSLDVARRRNNGAKRILAGKRHTVKFFKNTASQIYLEGTASEISDPETKTRLSFLSFLQFFVSYEPWIISWVIKLYNSYLGKIRQCT